MSVYHPSSYTPAVVVTQGPVAPTSTNHCLGTQQRFQNTLNTKIEFLFRTNSCYVGQTDVYPNTYLGAGKRFANSMVVKTNNKTQWLSTVRTALQPSKNDAGYYHMEASIQDTMAGKKYQRNTNNGHGWNLLLVERTQPSDTIYEIYEGEGVSEFLPPEMGIVQLRLKRHATLDQSRITHDVFYRLCQSNSDAGADKWVPLSASRYDFACATV
jgi:hypothetical protein